MWGPLRCLQVSPGATDRQMIANNNPLSLQAPQVEKAASVRICEVCQTERHAQVVVPASVVRDVSDDWEDQLGS